MDTHDVKPKFFKTKILFLNWLDKNHETLDFLWVGFFKVKSGKESMTWPESVEAAICYGWIDGLRKSIDESSYMIRFTPRKKNSIWSAVNLKIVERLIDEGKIHSKGLRVYQRRKTDKSKLYSFEQGEIKLPEEYISQFKRNKTAWKFFQALPPSTVKLSIWWVISAKKEETRSSRLKKLIECSEKHEKIPQLVTPKK